MGAVFIAPPTFGYFYTMGTRWPQGFKTDNEQLKRYMEFEKSVLAPMFYRVPEAVAAKMQLLEQGAEGYFTSLSPDV